MTQVWFKKELLPEYDPLKWTKAKIVKVPSAIPPLSVRMRRQGSNITITFCGVFFLYWSLNNSKSLQVSKTFQSILANFNKLSSENELFEITYIIYIYIYELFEITYIYIYIYIYHQVRSKKRTCRLVDFVIPANQILKVKESYKTNIWI